MKTHLLFSRLSSAQSPITLTADEAHLIGGQINYLEKVIAILLASIKRRKKTIDVQLPYRA